MTDTHIITDHALGDLVRLSRDVTIELVTAVYSAGRSRENNRR